MIHPNMMGKIIQMFQTTNQISNISHHIPWTQPWSCWAPHDLHDLLGTFPAEQHGPTGPTFGPVANGIYREVQHIWPLADMVFL